MDQLKASSMIRFGLVFLIINLIAALVFYIKHDQPRTVMFMIGAIIWIVSIIIWRSVEAKESNS